MSIQSELDNTEQLVLQFMQRAIEEALQGMVKQVPSEVTMEDEVNPQDIKFLEKWAKKMYLHYPKEAASLVIDMTDEVHVGTFSLVKKMVDRTVYNAIATHLHVTMTLSSLRNMCPEQVVTRIHQKAAEILITLYQQDDMKSIASLHVEAALYRAADLTQLYVTKRKKDLAQSLLQVRSAAVLAEEMNQLHENAMNYFYRQATNLLQKEEENAKQQVKEKYSLAYRQLLETKTFRKDMRAWLAAEIFPHVQQLNLTTPPKQQRRPFNGPPNPLTCT